MSVGILILLLLSPGEPGLIDTIESNPLTLLSISKDNSPELLDDFDTDPQNPEDDWIAMDKFWHWALSFSLTGSTYHFIHNQLNSADPEAMIISLSSVLVFSVLKEFYDLARYNLFSFKDLCYDVLGMATGYLVFIWDWDPLLLPL